MGSMISTVVQNQSCDDRFKGLLELVGGIFLN